MALCAAVRCLSSHIRPTFRVLQKCQVLSKAVHPDTIFTRPITISSALLDDKKFSRDHEWVLPDGDVGTVGITDYAQDKLGDIVFIELPQVGSSYEQDDVFGTVESVKAASDVVTPVSGEVVETNETLESSPQIVNSDPYKEGWLIRIKMSNPEELDGLMSEAEYEKYIEECD